MPGAGLDAWHTSINQQKSQPFRAYTVAGRDTKNSIVLDNEYHHVKRVTQGARSKVRVLRRAGG